LLKLTIKNQKINFFISLGLFLMGRPSLRLGLQIKKKNQGFSKKIFLAITFCKVQKFGLKTDHKVCYLQKKWRKCYKIGLKHKKR
jgi:hypothetical protein